MLEQQQVAQHDGGAPKADEARSAPHGAGEAAVQGLLRSGSSDPASYATVLQAHPGERSEIVSILHKTLGNAFVQRVVAVDPGHKKQLAIDVVIERLAHGIAYKDAPSDEDVAFLQAHGLQVGKVVHGTGGLDFTELVPVPGSGATPVLAFRGTQGMTDLVADADPAGVGAYQMAANEGVIAAALGKLGAYGKPIVTGHSLGGALAQMTAARLPGLVGRVVTFQSPGIPKEMVDKLDAYNAKAKLAGKDEVESQHYAVKGDIVPLGGQAFTSGFLSTISTPGRHFLADHSAYPLKDLVDSGGNPGRERVGHVDDRWGKTSSRLHQFAEALRVGTGHAISVFERAGHKGASPRQAYVELWDQVRDAIDAGAKTPTIEALINGSKVRPEDKQLMLSNLHALRD